MAFGLDLSGPGARNKLIAGVIPLLVLFVYWYLYHGDRVLAVTELKTHYEELDGKNTAAKVLAARGGPELQKRLAIYEQHMVRLEQLIPKSEEVPQLLHSMTLRAQDAGVELVRMKPETEEPGEFYTKQTYTVGVIGPYHRVGRFLSAVGSLSRIITPVNVSLQKRPELARDGTQNLEALFKIETYVIPEQVIAPPTPPPAKPNA
jgi:Tfp pilus assembly protein PilO